MRKQKPHDLCMWYKKAYIYTSLEQIENAPIIEKGYHYLWYIF